MTTTGWGPVSALLAEQLAACTRERGVVVWFDGPGHYTSFVDRLLARADELPYAIRAFRGSYLELILALDNLAADVDPTPLLVHLRGVEKARIASTPLYELYLASCVGSPSDPAFVRPLERLVDDAASGRVRPEDIASFRDRIGQLGDSALDEADAWLTDNLDVPISSVAAKLRVMRPTEVLTDLLGPDEQRRVAIPGDAEALWERLGVWLGLPNTWRDAMLRDTKSRAEDIAAVASSWSLCVEYVDDLRTRKPKSARLQGIDALPSGVVAACREVARYLREHHPAYYRRIADETEAQLADEVDDARAEDLGRIDTFRFEDVKVLEAALAALGEGQWDRAAEWAQQRVTDESPWLRHDPHRHATWLLLLDAAQLGQALVRAGGSLARGGGLTGAIEQYVQRGAAVDQAHRWLEQRRSDCLDTQMPEFERLRARLDGMRVAWRAWADAWSRDFNAICREAGFLPPPNLQQRMLFDDVVRESCRQPGTTALFVVDALRFEMAQELAASLGEPEQTWLDARLAELPTITAVGMNVLAPVATRGRLRPVVHDTKIVGFNATGEFQVRDPETRLRAMHDRIGGRKPESLGLDALLGKDRRSLARKLATQSLVIVHSSEIDEAGESGQGLGVFTRILQKLRGAWHLLRSAGVQRFVFTADHGFLLLDESAATAQPYKRKIDPKRRYVLEPTAAVEYPNEVRVRLSELGYDVAGEAGDRQIVVPETTAVFDTGRRSESFVHGGNSLQERVIPVLRLVHGAPAGGVLLRYAIEAKPAPEQGGMHCIEAKVVLVADGALDFGGVREIELALRVTDVPAVEVDLGSVRDGARIERGVIHAALGEAFLVYFRLRGRTDARVQVELYHPSHSVEVRPRVVERRFAVIDTTPISVAPTPSTAGMSATPATPAIPSRPSANPATLVWLERLPAGGVRDFFAHLAAHRIVTAVEAERMLGGARALRRFAVDFDEYVEALPFEVRIEVVGGIKRYVREGS